MTEQAAANNVETAPQVDEAIEEQANSQVDPTDTPEAVAAEGEGDTFIPEGQITDGVQKRINKLTWEKHEAERKAATKIQELEDQLKAANAAPVQSNKAPTLAESDYDDEAHQQKLAIWAAKQAQPTVAPAQPAPQAVDPAVASFLQKRQKYAEENTDYTQMSTDPLMANVIPQGSAMESYIIAAESGPKLHHHLLNNAPELIRIQSLPEWAQGAELAKIESKMNQVRPKAKSNAPEPVKPVSNGKPSATGKRKSAPFPY